MFNKVLFLNRTTTETSHLRITAGKAQATEFVELTELSKLPVPVTEVVFYVGLRTRRLARQSVI